MKFSALLSLAAVVCWETRDLLGTFVSIDGGCQDVNEVHFGDKEVFVKRFCSEGQENQLFRGHWYKSNATSILQGGPNLVDSPVAIQYTPEYIVYGNTKLTRATAPTPIDTLAMVGYGYYSSKDTKLQRVSFTEGGLTMFFDGSTDSGPWTITSFTPTQVTGKLTLQTEEIIPIAITKTSPTSLRINDIEFSLES